MHDKHATKLMMRTMSRASQYRKEIK